MSNVSPHEMPQYSWCCLVCDSANGASAEACTACGFPSRATGAQIDRARAVRRGTARSVKMPGPDLAAQLEIAIKPLPFYRKIPAVLGGLITVAGGVWFKLAWSWSGIAYALLALVLGLGLIALAYSEREDQDKHRHAG